MSARTPKHPRLRIAARKMVKWGGAMVALVLLVAWIGSSLGNVYWFPPSRYYAGVMSARLFIVDTGVIGNPGDPKRFRFEQPGQPGWCFDPTAWPVSRFYSMPLWPLPLLSLLATAAAWRVEAKYLRRAREGACPACGYDRAGLAAGAVCPECGGCGGGTIEQMAAQP